jgi:tRNA A37 threonylcarbamoyladenosine modification protein TsaB
MQTYISDAAIVEEIVNNTPLALDDYEEASLKLMFTYNGQQKETLQDAKGLKQEKAKELKYAEVEQKQEVENWQAVQQQYLKSKNDFNKYLD